MHREVVTAKGTEGTREGAKEGRKADMTWAEVLQIGGDGMNAYELSEKKNKLISKAGYLHGELDNSTETVLLTNDEVLDIIEMLEECVGFINEKLKTVQVD